MEGKDKAETEQVKKVTVGNVKYVSNYNKSKHIKLARGTISAKKKKKKNQNKPNSVFIKDSFTYIKTWKCLNNGSTKACWNLPNMWR